MKIIEQLENKKNNLTGGKISTGSGLKTDKKPDKNYKKSGFLQKVASVGQKIGSGYEKLEKGADFIHKLGTQGKFDLKGISQKILDKLHDKDTDKITYFGKKNFNKVKLSENISNKIIQFKGVTKKESFQRDILKIINEANILYVNNFCKLIEKKVVPGRDQSGKFQVTGGKSRSIKANLHLHLGKEFKLNKDEWYLNKRVKVKQNGVEKEKKVTHPIINYISKNPVAVLKKIKKIYSDLDLKFTPHSKEYGASSTDINVKVHENTNTNSNNSGSQSKSKYDIDKIKLATKLVAQKRAKIDDWLKVLGKSGVIYLLVLMKKLFPGDRISFPEADKAKKQREIESKLMFTFTLKKPNNLGEKGLQYNLIPDSTNVQNYLNNKGIKYITYLVQKNKSIGNLYMYDENNNIISDLTVKDSSFRWDSKFNGYIIGAGGYKAIQPNYKKGELPILKSDKSIVKVTPDRLHYKIDNAVIEYPIIRFNRNDNMYIVNSTKGKLIK